MSSKLRTYIVEDEPQAIELLLHYLRRIPYLECAGTARDPLKALDFLQEHPVDLLLLDINMAELSGMKLYQQLHPPPKVIFTTAYAHYAVEAFELEALDYLVKPFNFERFQKACERAKPTAKPPAQPAGEVFRDVLYIKSGTVTHKLSWSDILYLQKDENYVVYFTRQGKRILSRQTISDLETIFPDYICRTHKSYAVSLLHVEKIEREQLSVQNIAIPIGRTYRERVGQQLAKWSGKG
ncbi:MAG: response regulator transcription factor [Bacteroidota bacterium]